MLILEGTPRTGLQGVASRLLPLVPRHSVFDDSQEFKDLVNLIVPLHVRLKKLVLAKTKLGSEIPCDSFTWLQHIEYFRTQYKAWFCICTFEPCSLERLTSNRWELKQNEMWLQLVRECNLRLNGMNYPLNIDYHLHVQRGEFKILDLQIPEVANQYNEYMHLA